MHRLLIGIGLIALVGVVIFQPSFGVSLQSIFAGRSSAAEELTSEDMLVLQIAALKSQLAQSTDVERRASAWPAEFEPAFVYSRYPFNFKNEFVITAGENRGVRVGDPIVIPQPGALKPILVGKVIAVYEASALVRTVFDANFQMPVRVGPHAVDALFVGGPEPRLTLIPKKAELAEGDAIYSASPNMPYGLTLGEALHITLAENQAFQEADAALPYDVNTLTVVAVLKDSQ